MSAVGKSRKRATATAHVAEPTQTEEKAPPVTQLSAGQISDLEKYLNASISAAKDKDGKAKESSVRKTKCKAYNVSLNLDLEFNSDFLANFSKLAAMGNAAGEESSKVVARISKDSKHRGVQTALKDLFDRAYKPEVIQKETYVKL